MDADALSTLPIDDLYRWLEAEQERAKDARAIVEDATRNLAFGYKELNRRLGKEPA